MIEDVMKQQAAFLSDLARTVFALANTQLGEGSWSRIVFDYRVTQTGKQAMHQFRSLTPDGVKHLSSEGTEAVTARLHKLRVELPGQPWYGLCMVTRSDGRVHVAYNYDKTCIDGILEDASFYHDLL